MSESEFEKFKQKLLQDCAIGSTELKGGVRLGMDQARDWILDYCMRNARESITDQEYLFVDDLKRLLK